jgi:hypothetical protein
MTGKQETEYAATGNTRIESALILFKAILKNKINKN